MLILCSVMSDGLICLRCTESVRFFVYGTCEILIDRLDSSLPPLSQVSFRKDTPYSGSPGDFRDSPPKIASFNSATNGPTLENGAIPLKDFSNAGNLTVTLQFIVCQCLGLLYSIYLA